MLLKSQMIRSDQFRSPGYIHYRYISYDPWNVTGRLLVDEDLQIGPPMENT